MATGLLTNQVGYDTNCRARWVFRSDRKDRLSESAVWRISTCDGSSMIEKPWTYWGELWGEHWWVGETEKSLPEGLYELETLDGDSRRWSSIVEFADKLYFRKTFEPVALGQYERRAHIPTVGGQGWIDCGGYLSEANSHAVSVIGMCLVLEQRQGQMSAEQLTRLLRQIRHGSRYFLFLANQARGRGMPEGTYQHEPMQPTQWVIQDGLQIGIALCMAAKLLISEEDTSLRTEMIRQAHATFRFFQQDETALLEAFHAQLKPCPPDNGAQLRHFSARTHALPDDCPEPETWTTRELLLWLHFMLLIEPLAGISVESESGSVVTSILNRWHDTSVNESGTQDAECWFVPFLRTFQPEVAWAHHSVGRDTGSVFPHWVLPLWEWSERFPGHKLAGHCRQVVERFVQGYLLKAAAANPFGVLPNTWKPGEGWLHFAGLWHGMNGSYALMASQCFWLAGKLPHHRDGLRALARAQLDWIAGLNVGITQSNQKNGCLMHETDVPVGEAFPASMIFGVGQRWAGGWRNIRGSICNGFSAGKQFHFDVEPRVLNDCPDSFTDEDWITHTGAWLAALAFEI